MDLGISRLLVILELVGDPAADIRKISQAHQFGVLFGEPYGVWSEARVRYD